MRIALIGTGKMASALAHGLTRNTDGELRICGYDPNAEALESFCKIDPRIASATCPEDAADGAFVVVFCVKPQQMAGVVAGVSSANTDALLVSIAAGIPLQVLQQWSGAPRRRWVRVMPNTPLQVGAGMTALCGHGLREGDQETAISLFAHSGKVTWIEEESQMDAVTALSGSGPAFIYQTLDAMARAAAAEGLPYEQALTMAAQTALGAARMMQESGLPPEELTAQVTSKGGTTEAGLAVLRSSEMREIWNATLHAAARRSRELAGANS